MLGFQASALGDNKFSSTPFMGCVCEAGEAHDSCFFDVFGVGIRRDVTSLSLLCVATSQSKELVD